MNSIAQQRATQKRGFADARRAGKKGTNEEASKFRAEGFGLGPRIGTHVQASGSYL